MENALTFALFRAARSMIGSCWMPMKPRVFKESMCLKNLSHKDSQENHAPTKDVQVAIQKGEEKNLTLNFFKNTTKTNKSLVSSHSRR